MWGVLGEAGVFRRENSRHLSRLTEEGELHSKRREERSTNPTSAERFIPKVTCVTIHTSTSPG